MCSTFIFAIFYVLWDFLSVLHASTIYNVPMLRSIHFYLSISPEIMVKNKLIEIFDVYTGGASNSPPKKLKSTKCELKF